MILLAPAFLFGLFALAIPIIIHLVQLRKPKRILFTNVAFIRKVDDITSSQKKVKQWLILLSRLLFLTFLVLVFCQPFIPASNIKTAKLNDIKVYIDNSMSMQNEAEAGSISLLEKASDEAKNIINAFPGQTEFQLLDNTFRVSANRNLNKENLKQQVSGLSFSPLSRSTPVIYSRLQAGNSNKGSAAFWFSDFQKSAFSPEFFKNTDSLAAINLVVMRPASPGNVYVDSVALEDELVRKGDNNRLMVRLFNTSDEPKNNLNVKLFIGSRQASAISVNLNPKSSVTARIDFQINGNEQQNARIEIEDQPVIFDNVFYFTLQPASPISILDISGNPQVSFRRLFTNEPLFNYQNQSVSEINYKAIAEADVIFLNELPNLDAALADNLRKYVTTGGNLVVVPAPVTTTNSGNDVFQQLGLPVHSLSGNSVSELALPDLKNPFFRNVFAELDRRLQMPKSPLQVSWQQSDEDLLRFKNGGKFLSRFKKGQGDIFVFASAFTPDANEFNRNAIFVPVMYKLALSSYRSEQQLAYNFSQRTFALPVPKTDIRKQVFSLENDSAKFIPEQQLRNGKMYFTIPAEMAEAGFYKLKHNDSTLTTLAFNYPKNESRLEYYTADELKQQIKNKNVRIFESGAGSDFSAQIAKETKGTPLWQYCLLLALLFLLTEVLLIRFL